MQELHNIVMPGGVKVVRLDDPQTWNMYAYARNNPTTLTDPSGESWWTSFLSYAWPVYWLPHQTHDDPPPEIPPPPSPEAQVAQKQNPQSLRGQIPSDVRAQMATAITDSNSPTGDDKKGGFHEEYGVAGTNASGNWVVSRDLPGPAAPTARHG